MAKATKKTVST